MQAAQDLCLPARETAYRVTDAGSGTFVREEAYGGNTGSGDGSCKKEEACTVGDSGRFEE